MPAKKKAALAADTLVAKTAIAIEGKHFDAGAPIKGVSDEELQRAVNARRVVTFDEYLGNRAADTDPDPEEDSTEDEPEA